MSVSYVAICGINKWYLIISFLCTEEAYQAMQSYEARAEDELSFDIGVTLKVVEKNLDGWWLAR